MEKPPRIQTFFLPPKFNAYVFSKSTDNGYEGERRYLSGRQGKAERLEIHSST